MKYLILVLLPSCVWLEDYTAGDVVRKVLPNRIGVAYSQDSGHLRGWDSSFEDNTSAVILSAEWDVLAQPVRIESFGQFRAQALRLPVGDPEVLEALVVIKAQLDNVEEDAEAMTVELVAIHGEVDTDAFLDKLWVKLGLGGGGLGITTLLLLLLRSRMKEKAETPE
jgi:hypothetical protein